MFSVRCSMFTPFISSSSPDHADICRHAATHVESEEAVCILDLTIAGGVRELTIGFPDLADSCRADRMAVSDQTAARVDGDRTLETGRAFFNQHSATTGFRKAKNFVLDDLADGKTIMHFRGTDVRGSQARHLIGLFARFARHSKSGHVFLI